MERVVEPEWLDELPASDSRASRSRQDLRRINALMGNAALVAASLRRNGACEMNRLVELGAGDGSFALSLARRLSSVVQLREVTLIDQAAFTNGNARSEFAKLGCALNVIQADAFDWLAGARSADLVVANLFLHHFEEEPLQKLLHLAASRSRVFIACEPRRSAMSLAGSRLVGLIGCNDVTRHDAVASVRAGFSGCELSSLWPEHEDWVLEERPAGVFSHLFIARRAAES
jgi:SAM-dependent methyltransferase